MVITIGGEYGCGSQEVAEALAAKLGYKLCDNEIVTEALKEFGIDTESSTFQYYDESMGSAPVSEIEKLSKLQKGYRFAIVKLSNDVMPLDMRMDNAMREVQKKLADEGNCILIGRCANYYLRGRSDVISIFFADSPEAKEQRIMKRMDVSLDQARKLIKKTDKRRSDFYSYFTGESWDDPDNYDLRIQTKALGIDGSASLIEEMVKIREGQK